MTLGVGAPLSAQPIHGNPDFRIGKLDNGMTYYLYHNANPAGCAEFFIAHNVGALQEEDNQNGLAHFLEHMAFNGTRHYPGKGLLNFLSKEGVRFGYNVNAYTSRTETVYNISAVPLVRESFVDSVLLILHDWSCDISCEQAALDEERGVISEEWRLRDEQRYRMMCRQNELIYRGGKQPERTVLGTLEVINGFKREEILDFYHKWYRPDMQAIIIVGDFDVEEMESKVKAKFSDIAMPQNPPQKPSGYMPPKQDGPIIADMTDPAVKFKAFKIIHKQPYPTVAERSDEYFIRDLLARQIVTSVLYDRIKERAKKKGCPYSSTVLVTSPSAPEFYTSMFTIMARKDDTMRESIAAILEETERMIRFGMSDKEFEVAKFNVLKGQKFDREIFPEDVTSKDIVKRCLENFLRSYPCITPIEWQQAHRRILSEITKEDVAPYPAMMFRESEKIYSNCLNVADGKFAVSPEAIREEIARVESADLQPQYLTYKELDLSVSATPGTISGRKILGHGIREWKLSNGATAYFMPSNEVKSDMHLAMEAVFDAGYRAYPQDNIAAGMFAANFYKRYAGFRGVDRTLQKNYPELSGISTLIGSKDTRSYISVNAQKAKAENAFKALYLQINEPCFAGGRTLEKSRNDALKQLARKKDAVDLYSIRENKVYYGENPWDVELDSAAVEAVTMKLVEEQFRREFGDVTKMKLYICSDLPEKEIEDYVCRYVASIGRLSECPSVKASPLWQAYRKRAEISEEVPPRSEPMCSIDYRFSKSVRKTVRARQEIAVLDYILSDRYLNQIREARGGAYHVDFTTDVFSEPQRPVESVVKFQTRPELRDILLSDIENEMERFCSDGPTAKEMDAAVKYLIKHGNERDRRNENSVVSKLDKLISYVRYGIEFDYDRTAVLSSIKPSDVRKMARKISSGDRFISVYTEK